MKYDMRERIMYTIVITLSIMLLLTPIVYLAVLNTEYNNICSQEEPGYVVNKSFITEDHWTHTEYIYHVTTCTKDNTADTQNVTEYEYSSVQEGDIIKWNI